MESPPEVSKPLRAGPGPGLDPAVSPALGAQRREPKVKHRLLGFESRPRAAGGNPGKIRTEARGGESQAPGTGCLTFGAAAIIFEPLAGWPQAPDGTRGFPRPRAPAKGTESQAPGARCLTLLTASGKRKYRKDRARKRARGKSSTGDPVLDFWNRRRKFRNGCGLARPPVGFREGNRKSSTGYPGLDF